MTRAFIPALLLSTTASTGCPPSWPNCSRRASAAAAEDVRAPRTMGEKEWCGRARRAVNPAACERRSVAVACREGQNIHAHAVLAVQSHRMGDGIGIVAAAVHIGMIECKGMAISAFHHHLVA